MKSQYSIFFVLTICFYSCEKQDDFSKVSKNYQYQADIALAVSNSNFTLKEMGVNLPFGWLENPLALSRLENIKLQDTFTFDLSNIAKDYRYIKDFSFSILTKNEFPVEGKLYLLFANTFRQVFDTLDTPIQLRPTTISGDSTISIAYLEPSLIVSRDQLVEWSRTRYIIILGSLKNDVSDTNQYFQYSKYKILVELGIRVKFDFNLNEVVQ